MKIYIFAVLGIFLFLGQDVLAEKVSKNSTANSRVILSSYIKSGQLEEAKVASLINWGRESLDGIPSYSGFFTVNETTNSNLFFWFVPAMVRVLFSYQFCMENKIIITI
jgi:vitellogenic carboxypeptidase-like protein